MEDPGALNFQDLSGADSAEEEEDRSDEIKQLLTEAFSNETFDDDSSETSYADTSHRERQRLSRSENGLTKLVQSSDSNNTGNRDGGHYFRNLNTNGGTYRNGSLGSFFNGIGVGSEDVEVLNGNLNGASNKKVRFHSNSEQNVNIFRKGRQSDRGDDEIEVQNETVSMLHQKHCPQNGHNGSGEGSEIGEKLEQLQALLELREKRIKKLEEEAEVYAKDKRSLNHQVGLMKTEMIQMKNAGDELQRVIELRDEEIRYLKTKMTEAIEEYEQVRQQEMNAREETNRYADEVTKLQQKVQLLSSVGTATQQAETNDVVRQIRERHAKEIAVWQSTAADLESQLLIYKRGQQNALHESLVVHQEDAAIQTEDEEPTSIERESRSCQVEELEPKKILRTACTQTEAEKIAEIQHQNLATQTDRTVEERRHSAMELQSLRKVDFGQFVNLIPNADCTDSKEEGCASSNGVATATQVLNIEHDYGNVLEKWKLALAKCEEEKNKLIDVYEKEVEEYKTKLAVLPSKLYDVWTKQQEELGLLFGRNSINLAARSPISGRRSSVAERRPVLVDKATQGGPGKEQPLKSNAMSQTVSTPSPVVATDAPAEAPPDRIVAQLRDSVPSRSVTGTFSERETSSVVIQTDETLETFNMLGDLIQGWAQEVKQSHLRAELAEKQAYAVAEKYVKLDKSLKALKKDSKEKEILLNQKCEEQRLKFLSILSKVASKLDIFVE